MILFGELYFFICMAILLIPAFILGVMQKPIKYYGFFITVIFAAAALAGKPADAFYLIGYCVYQMVIISIYLRLRLTNGRRKHCFHAFILLALAPLLIYKAAGLFGENIFGFIGISYMTFKAVQVVTEIYDDLIKELKPFDFIYFLTFFPALSSGPIDRSRRFEADLVLIRPRSEYLELAGNGLFKICLGLVYKFVLASAFYQAIAYIPYLGNGQVWWSHLIYMYAYGFYLFFDFAGYSLMAVGTSYILGIETPDNFNKPFVSADIKEFWDRWHISLSHWFRDFVFSRFMMASIRGKWFKNKLTGASCGFLINMLLMGMWHGLTASYILYGLYHGVLLALTEIYQKKSKFHKKHKKQRIYKIVSCFVTFNLVMFGFFIFSGRFLEII